MEKSHLLIVEGDASDQKRLVEALRQADWRKPVTVISDGESALKFLRREAPYQSEKKPYLIVLELNLPKLGGREVLTAIKESPEWACIPVVILAHNPTAEDVEFCYLAYANCVIKKPDSAEDFARVVNAVKDFWLDKVELPGQHQPLLYYDDIDCNGSSVSPR